MSFSLAEHRGSGRTPRVDRTLHIGILVCFGLQNARPRRAPEPLTLTQLGLARGMILGEILSVWRPFTLNHNRSEYHYQFAVEVVVSSLAAPVQTISMNMDVSEVAEREGLFRDARSTLVEAHQLGLENIAAIATYLVGSPHGQTVSAVQDVRDPGSPNLETERRLGALGALQERTSNAIVLEYSRDLMSRTLTAAHETGHLLGLTNARGTTSIMGPRNSDEQARGRRVTPEDRSYLHAAIESRLPGIERPPAAQTSGRQSPYRFDGVYSREEP